MRRSIRGAAISLGIALAIAVARDSPDDAAAAVERGPHAAIRMTVLGDSLAFGTGATDPRNALAFRVYRALLADRPGTDVTNDAVGGSRVLDVTRLQVPQVEANADLVFIVVGGNDVVRRTPAPQFASEYARLLAAVRSRAPHATIVVCGVPDVARSPLFANSYTKTEELSRIDDAAVRAATNANGAAYVDLFTVTRTRGINPDFFSSDDFHPSDAGYERLADVAIPIVRRALQHR